MPMQDDEREPDPRPKPLIDEAFLRSMIASAEARGPTPDPDDEDDDGKEPDLKDDSGDGDDATPPPEGVLVNDNRKNARKVLCNVCGTVIIRQNTAKFVYKDIVLHKTRVPKGTPPELQVETLNEHWFVPDKYDFENIAVCLPSVTKGVAADFRYLACGGCDAGPLGIYYTKKPKRFYLAHERIAYSDK